MITGGARRLGAAIARAVHGQGASVVVHYHRSAAAAEALVDDMNDRRRGSAHAVGANLLDARALPRLVQTALDRCGRLDVLVNNASSFYPTPVGEITLEQFEDLVGTNLRAPLFLCAGGGSGPAGHAGTHPQHGGHPRPASPQGACRLLRGEGGPRHADPVARP